MARVGVGGCGRPAGGAGPGRGGAPALVTWGRGPGATGGAPAERGGGAASRPTTGKAVRTVRGMPMLRRHPPNGT
ncbi:hypothetical protein Ga0074812_104319 [Parafrankia irregularis]|uniref:Uncharacterized protein n=1 Tax=Parafrankia irregularis TaxID=795642 RepID=A0A0S4QL34_9ACTN|nr:hypothetical protein Ga0074812_104319 [Parafrankia irregularis]